MSENVEALTKELNKYRKWVNDLQSGMYINCVYCGHRYGPQDKVPASMADVLKDHIEQCPDHPMSKLKKRVKELEAVAEAWERVVLASRKLPLSNRYEPEWPQIDEAYLCAYRDGLLTLKKVGYLND